MLLLQLLVRAMREGSFPRYCCCEQARHYPRCRTGRGALQWEGGCEDHEHRRSEELHHGCCAYGHRDVLGDPRLDAVRLLRHTRFLCKERGAPVSWALTIPGATVGYNPL